MNAIISKKGLKDPFFTVVIVDSRSDKYRKWVEKSIFSVKEQTIENLELVIIDNHLRDKSIGACYNEGLRLATGKWVYFLGDDDYLSFDYLASLKTYIDNFTDEKCVIASTFCTFFTEDSKESKSFDKFAMGAYRKEYFINHLFNEKLKRHIDIDAVKRACLNNKLVKVCRWHYGYFYRQHSDNVSGRKKINNNTILVETDENDLQNITALIQKSIKENGYDYSTNARNVKDAT